MPVDSRLEIVRPSLASDTSALTGLFEEMFGKRPSEAWWNWKYRSHPVGALSLLCETGDEVVAHCGGTMVDFKIGGEIVRAMQVVDVMASRSHGSGAGGGSVFARTTLAFFREAYTRGVRLVYGFPGERHHRAGERLFGYTRVGPVGELVLEPVAGDEHGTTLGAENLREFGLEGRSECGAIRDPAWLRWRYLDHPEHRYEYVDARGAFSRLRASAIIRESEQTIHLMELGGRSDVRSLRALTSRLSRLGRPVTFWCSPTHEISARLVRCGFRMSTRDHSLANLWYRDPSAWSGRAMFGEDALDGRATYYTMGDYDVH